MNHAKALPLSATGPQLLEGELDYVMHQPVHVYDGDIKTAHRQGSLRLTSHRFLYIAPDNKSGFYVNISDITGYEHHGAGIFASAKLEVRFKDGGSLKFGFKKSSSMATRMKESLEMVKKREAWKKKEAPKVLEHRTPAAQALGIATLMEDQKRRMAEGKKLTAEAFQDLDSLMKRAGEIVSLVNRYAEKKKQGHGSGGGGGSGENKEDEDAQFGSLIVSVGIIANPVTREIAGNRFNEELARQLAGYIKKPLEAAGGIMTLIEVYTRYNRARRTDLISPDDVYAAAELFQPLRLGMKLTTLESGYKVIQSDSLSVSAVQQKMKSMLLPPPRLGVATPANEATGAAAEADAESHRSSADATAWINTADLARRLGIPLAIAESHLLTAEKNGVVCRDESSHGIRFYANPFV